MSDTLDIPLSRFDEGQFQIWKQKYAPNDLGKEYDLRAAYKSGAVPDPETGAWPDEFRKPAAQPAPTPAAPPVAPASAAQALAQGKLAAQAAPASTPSLAAGKSAAQAEEDVYKKFAEEYPELIDIDPAEYELVKQAAFAANPENPEDELYRWGTAYAFSKIIPGTQPEELIGQVDQLTEWYTGQAGPQKSNYRAVIDSWRLGSAMEKYNTLADDLGTLEAQLEDALALDDKTAYSAITPQIEKIKKDMDEQMQFMGQLQDAYPRPLGIDLLKTAAQSGPFTVKAIVSGAVVGAVTGGLGAGATATSLAAKIASAAATYKEIAGASYMALRDAGVNPKLARDLSSYLDAPIQAAIESGLGESAGYIGRLINVPGVTAKVAKRMITSGQWGALGASAVQYATGIAGEGFEEALQSLSTDGTKLIASVLQDEGVELPKAQEVAAAAWSSYIEGVKGAIVLGAPGLVADISRNSKTSQGIQETKKIIAAEESEATPQMVDTAAFAKKAAEPLPAGTIVQARAEAEGEQYILKAGNKDSGERLGSLRYEMDPETQTARILGFEKAEPNVQAHLVRELSARLPGWSIEMEPRTGGQTALRDLLIQQNPRGPEAGLSYYEAPAARVDRVTEDYVRTRLQEVAPTWKSEDVDLAVKILPAWARRMGMTGSELADAALSREVFGQVLDKSAAAQAAGKNPAGVFLGVREGNWSRGLIDMAAHANPSTAIHEMTHAVINFARQARETPQVAQFLQEIEGVLGVKDGNWQAEFAGWTEEYRGGNRTFLEAITYAMEDYLVTGKAPKPELEGIFQKLAQWIRDIYQALKGARVQMTPELTSYFDELFGGEGSPFLEAKAGRSEADLAIRDREIAQAPADALAAQEGASQAAQAERRGIAGARRDLAAAKERIAAGEDAEAVARETGWRETGGEWRQDEGFESKPEYEQSETERELQEGKVAEDALAPLGPVEFTKKAFELDPNEQIFQGEAPLFQFDWGRKLDTEEGAGQAAVEKLLEAKHGYVGHIVFRPEIGWLDLPWGEMGDIDKDFAGGAGLLHIQKKHEESDDVIGKIEKIAKFGRVVPDPQYKGRRQILWGPYRMVIQLARDNGKPAPWIVTAFLEERQRKRTLAAGDHATDARAYSPSSPVQPKAEAPGAAERIPPANKRTIIVNRNKGPGKSLDQNDIKPDDALFQGDRGVQTIVYSFPKDLIGYSDIHSQAQLPASMNIFGRGVVAPSGEIRLGNAGSSHVGLASGLTDAKRFYFGYSREKKAVYVVAKNGMDQDALQRPAVLQRILSQVFDQYRLTISGNRLAFADVLYQDEELPPQEHIPETGTYPAVHTDDGGLYVDTEGYGTHVLFIQAKKIPVSRITSGGWIVDGVYDASDRSDTMRYVERELARQRVKEKRDRRAKGSDLLFQGDTNTPEFRAWFGDSKVVDEQGKPLVVYHGTPEFKGEAFDRAHSQKGPSKLGFWFTDDPNYADFFGSVKLETYLSIKKPKKITQGKWDDLRVAHGGDAEWFGAYRDQLIDEGYDGIMVPGKMDQLGGMAVRTPGVFAAFSPEQIKSIDNRGTWDPNDPRILYQDGEELADSQTRAAQGDGQDEAGVSTLKEIARGFATWEEFSEYIETPFGTSEAEPQDLAPAERQDWYRALWLAAREVKPVDLEDWTRRLEANAYEGLIDFLEGIWNEILLPSSMRDLQPEDMAGVDRLRDMKGELAETLVAGAQRVGTGRRSFDPRFLRSLMGTIRKNPEEYARIYGEVMAQPEIAKLGEAKEAEKYADIKDPRLEKRMSVSQKAALAAQIRDDQLASEVLSGKVQMDDKAKEYLRKLRTDQKAAKKKIQGLEADLKVAEAELSADEKKLASYRAESARTSQEIGRTKKRIERFLEKGQKVPRGYEGKLRTQEQRAKSLRSALARAGDFETLERQAKRLDERIAAVSAQISEAQARKGTAGPEALALRSRLQSERAAIEPRLRAAAAKWKDSAGLQTYLAKAEALAKAQEKYQVREAEARARKKLRAYQERLVKQIMAKVSDTLAVDEQKAILALQQMLDPAFRAERTQAQIDELRLELEKNPELAREIPKEWLRRATARNLNEMSLTELEEMAGKVRSLRYIGRGKKKARDAARRDRAERLAAEIADVIQRQRGYKTPSGYEPERKLLDRWKDKMRTFDYSFLSMRRIANRLDGGKDGQNVELLVHEMNRHYREEMAGTDRRTAAIMQAFKDAGVSADSWYSQTVTIEGAGPGGAAKVLRKSDLLALEMAFRNEDSRAAALYGCFFSETERKAHQGDQDWFDAQGAARFEAIRAAIDSVLTPADEQVLAALSADSQAAGARLAEVVAAVENRIFVSVEDYFPLFRQGVTQEPTDVQIVGDIKDRTPGLRRPPKNGFTKSRTTIPPWGQTAIKLDLLSTWLSAIQAQEHYLATAEYGKKLDAVYTSEYMREQIKALLGDPGVDYMKEYITEVKNPGSLRDHSRWEQSVRFLRGNLGAAYLTFRASSAIKQLVTSPWPTVPYAGPRVLGETFKCLANPVKYLKDTEALSVVLQHRVRDLVQQSIEDAQASSKAGKMVLAAEKMGMKGLQLADRFSVAVGWRACYEKALVEFKGDHEKAVEKADDIILKTQPSARGVDLAPIYRSGGEMKKLLLQFTQAMNVIWQNIRYDLPNAVKNHQFGTAVGILWSYAMAGILLNALTSRPPEDEDDDAQTRRLLFWSITQGTDSIPFVGQHATRLARGIITGEKDPTYPNSALPAIEEFFNGATRLTDGDFEKALAEFSSGAGMVFGLPVSGVKEFTRAITGDAGALLGRPRQ